MRRLGLFCFYDSEGIVDPYVCRLLADLKENVAELYIVVNGNVNSQGFNEFLKFTSHVLVRKNEGFDAGAYAAALESVGEESLPAYDELVLCNNSFYGMFRPLREIFEHMKGHSCDFWGMNITHDSFFTYIDSYFLVFRKRILENSLYHFFRTELNRKAEDFDEVSSCFEIGIFRYLLACGYTADCYSYTDNYSIFKDPDLCMKEYGFPLLKSKCFGKDDYDSEKLAAAIAYIRDNTDYDTELILSHAARRWGCPVDPIRNLNGAGGAPKREKNDSMQLTEAELCEFLEKYSSVYIWGTGHIASHIFSLFGKQIRDFRGFLVSEGRKRPEAFRGYPVRYVSETGDQCKGAAIIIAVNRKNTAEIRRQLGTGENLIYLYW